jgi:hypothetical protein
VIFGEVLFQLPHRFRKDTGRLRDFLHMLPPGAVAAGSNGLPRFKILAADWQPIVRAVVISGRIKIDGDNTTLEKTMAKRKRKYSRSAGSDVKSEMHRFKRGTAKSGKGGKGGKVKSRKQAIAIGLSKARKKGKKVPRKKS